ncbi:MAG: chromosome segregation SMC family protein, partial [Candidatus Kapaibacteriales bacterium]
MFLEKIELIGFKSFANKTVFKFNGGITAIVGPNGCGKTNIVDAVRWVLGEQKSSLIRSEVMENVIFNGSATRKPLGLAEVSITLLNDKQVIPAQFTEVTITRRLFRNGESSYFLNNTPCRLKDITELLMDTGIGANSYSVIELKMIESLLNGSLEERRRLLEEAAGITKFKSRKRETTKKLSSVQEDLIRIYDVVEEIEKQVNSLSRQASKTRKYNKLQQQLKELEISLWKREFETIIKTLTNLEIENQKLSKTKEDLLSKQNDIDVEIHSLEDEIDNLSNQIQDILQRESDLSKKSFNLKENLAVNNERIKGFSNSLQKLITEKKDAENLLLKYENSLAKLEMIKSQKEKELLNHEINFKNLQEDYNNELN